MQPLPTLQPLPLPRTRRPSGVTPSSSRTWRGRVVVMGTAGALTLAASSHSVQPRDTLSAIAAQHGVTVDALVAANDLADPDRILVGDELTIPDPPDTPAAGADAPADVEQLLERTAREYGWSPRFVKAIAWQESGWQQDQVSSAGAIGIMQVMPGTGEFVSRELAGRDLDLDDPADNVEAGVRFLDYLWQLTDGDPELTLAGYYQGLASVSQNGWYDDTERYVDNVLALRDRF